ncbi:hypothetical protein [Chitinophaga arvensicola]|uniref:hypothetical protein n=1 Tax=Chitinophaga arvensicola TaxID=29529 RepID=UPI000B7E00B8|nr:hypothetical protein [Chitinophaga arvensicola]
MKSYLIAIILLGCIGSIANDTCTKLWSVGTTHKKTEYDFVDAFSAPNLSLADSICVEKCFLDSAINSLSDSINNQSFIVNKIVFKKAVSRNYFFLNDSIDVHKIYWNKENTEYGDFSSFILYTKKYGVIYKFFRKKGKDFFRWRLLSIKYNGNKAISLNAFTNTLLNDTILFDRAPLIP